VQDRNPAQAKQQFGTGGKFQPWRDAHRANVDVRLIEPVEEHQSIGTGAIELIGDVRQRREEGRELDGHWNLDEMLQIPDNTRQFIFHGVARCRQVRGYLVHVQLEGIGPRLFDDTGKLQPGFRGSTVQRTDNRNRYGLLGATHVLGILIWSERVIPRLWKCRQYVGEVRFEDVDVRDSLGVRIADLLFEQRMQDERGAAGVLESLDRIEPVAERGGASDERVG